MKTVDFSRSFLTFRIDIEKKPPKTVTHKPPYSLNNARIQLECRCRVTDNETGQLQTFVLGASCKTEQVGVERDIWLQPNADFVPIFSDTGFLTIKTYAQAGMQVDFYPPGSGKQPDRQTGDRADVFDDSRVDITEVEGVVLTSAKEVVDATLAGYPLVARTEITQGRYTAVLEYPVKTMNANERDWIYQTDTGPVLLPDFSRQPDDLLPGLELAFAAFNCPDWVEFIVRVPTEIDQGISVFHYSRPVRFDASNQVIRLA
jgi:hypothetical protein